MLDSYICTVLSIKRTALSGINVRVISEDNLIAHYLEIVDIHTAVEYSTSFGSAYYFRALGSVSDATLEIYTFAGKGEGVSGKRYTIYI